MVLTQAGEYLAKQIAIENNVVTFRSLSRAVGIHVNVAKNELAAYITFCRTRKDPICATYFLAGPAKSPVSGANGALPESDDVPELIPRLRVLVVEENALEIAKSQLEKVTSLHVYSLSATRILDPNLLIGPTELVLQQDALKPASTVGESGRIAGADVKLAGKAVSGTSKLKATTSLSAQQKRASPFELKKSSSMGSVAPAATRKASVEDAEQKGKGGSAAKPLASAGSKSDMTSFFKKQEPGRPKSDTEPNRSVPNNPAMAKAVPKSQQQEPEPSIRLRKGVLLSDDEDATLRPSRGSKHKSLSSDIPASQKRSLRAMMDIDDVEVVNASRPTTMPLKQEAKHYPGPLEEEEEEEEEERKKEEEEEEEEHPPKPTHYIDKKPRKNKAKQKGGPIGRNGLEKRRVVRTRKDKDARGRTVTVDYSSWESVSEGEGDKGPNDDDSIVKANPVKDKVQSEKRPLQSNAAKPKGLQGFFQKKAG